MSGLTTRSIFQTPTNLNTETWPDIIKPMGFASQTRRRRGQSEKESTENSHTGRTTTARITGNEEK
ncbi:hypothetical protein N7540_008602 [Penicillium herquei]|nr:hypothetical protein N7540_008602 [Penicillium herquei]